MSDILMGAIFITAIAALPLWNWVSKKLDKRKAYALGISFWALAQVLLMTLTSSTPVGWVVALCILAGVGVSAAHVLPWAMIPDAIEYGELNTGERHEGVFYSLVTLMAKVASSIAVPLTAFVLELTGYIPNSSSQPQSALNGIRFLIGPIPAVCLIVGIVFALRYPLERNEFNEIVGKLKKQRTEEKEE
jgi:GPH family glycoside/pentoside/hexuronide:cation symporter